VKTFFLIAAVGLAGVVGCNERLETGYKPRKLGSTDVQRRAYYAAPFSPDAAPADGSGAGAEAGQGPGF
jgi:hypothetical protein